jgi:tetratricopeptide (TPR) repeat protein
LAGQVTLPDHDEVTFAREANAEEWAMLDAAYLLAQSSGWKSILPWLIAEPTSVRLHALVQDLRLIDEGRELAWADAQAQLVDDRSPLHLFLAARLCDSPTQAKEWLDEALQADPDFVLAQVLQLSLQSDSGYYAMLDPLRRLLAEHPGCAEAWRLLGMVAPLYARPDLARRAAVLEPWSGAELNQWATHYSAVRYLKAQDPRRALSQLGTLPPSDFEGRLLHACALGESGQHLKALHAMEALHEIEPNDMRVLFNLGLIEMQRLQHPKLALAWFELILVKAHEGQAIPFVRRMQVEAWASDLR